LKFDSIVAIVKVYRLEKPGFERGVRRERRTDEAVRSAEHTNQEYPNVEGKRQAVGIGGQGQDDEEGGDGDQDVDCLNWLEIVTARRYLLTHEGTAPVNNRRRQSRCFCEYHLHEQNDRERDGQQKLQYPHKAQVAFTAVLWADDLFRSWD